MINNRYQILNEIGSGGIGKVLKAIDLLQRKTVAIKVLLNQETEQVEGLKEEFLLLRKIQHPNIVKVYDVGYSDTGRPYFTMEHIEGSDLKTFLKPLDYSVLWQVMFQVLTALDFIHCKGIIHGDIKPSNILIINSPDSQVTVKFTDFGFAKHKETEESTLWKGTLPYLAPEIIRGEKYTPQADLYSLGILIYEILFGKPPFDEKNLMDLAKSHLEKDVVIPEEPQVPTRLKDLMVKLLKKDPIDRHLSAGDVLDQIQEISGVTIGKSETVLAKSLIVSADFIGRERELGVLKETLTHLPQIGSKFVLITGESGIGKARLINEFTAWAQLQGYSAIKISLKEVEISEALQERIFQLSATGSRSFILMVEHLELADDSFFKFLSDFIHKTPEKGVLICLTLSNDLTSPEEAQRTVEIEKRIRSFCSDSPILIQLNRLTESEEEKLVCSMFGLREDTKKITAVIHQETQGNPCLIGELLESLVEESRIRRDNNKITVPPECIEKSRIPQSVRDLTEKRCAGLKPESLELLASASIWGLEIEFDVFTKLAGFNNTDNLTCINEILSHGLMKDSTNKDKRKIRFVNNLIRRIIYEQVDSMKRKVLHQKAGEILERDIGSDNEEHTYELANHFYQAKDFDRALKYSLLSAKRAKGKCDHGRVITQYTRALELHDEMPSLPFPSEEEILENMADQFDLMGNFSQSLDLYQKALRIMNCGASNHQTALIYRKMGRIYQKMAQPDNALEFLEKSLKIFKTTESLKQYARTLINLGWVHLQKSDYQRAISQFEEALGILQKEVTSKEIGFALSGLGSAYWSLGDYSRANWYHHESLKVFKEIGDLKKIADCYGNLGIVARRQGELKKAIEYFGKCLELQETFRDPYRLSISYNNLALAYLDQSRWDQALECLGKAVQSRKKISDTVGLGFSYNNIGLIYLKKGEFCQALEYFNSAIVQFHAAQQKSGLALVYNNLGDLYAKREKFDQALGYLRKSLRRRKQLGEEAGTAESLFLMGKIFLGQSDFDRSKQHFLLAQSFYQKQGNKETQAEVLIYLAELLIKTGQLTQVETYLTQAQELLEELDNKFLEASLQMVRACLIKAMKDHHGCLKCLSNSARLFKELEAKFELGLTYLEMGKIKLKLLRYKEAQGFLMEALNIFEKTENQTKEKEVKSLLEQIRDLKKLENERTATFYQLAELLNNIWDTDELLSKSLELIIQLMNAERGAIIFYSEKDNGFEVKVSKGMEQETSRDALTISRQVLKNVVRADSPLIVQDAREDPRFAKNQSVVMYNILSILCVPLKTKNRLIGTVYLDHRNLPAIFSSDDVSFLKAFANLIATAIEKSELYVKANEEIFQLKDMLNQTYEYPEIIGKSMKMQEVFNLVEKVADSKTSVLILGENGTGKEVIANLIHARSQRRDSPFIKVNCAALPETLLESELFGVEEKTATGVGFRKGKFELADDGTIFLDEIGDMSLSVQAKVLRAIEEKEFERLGGQRSIKVDVRVLSATNMNLHKKIDEGSFRKDLFFRLNTILITIPPLRERKEDIPYLIDYFLNKSSAGNNKPPVSLSKRIIDALMEYSWPGNVRELEHILESAILLSEDGTFPDKILPKEVRKTKTMVNLDKYGKLEEVLNWVEKKKIRHTLEKNGWNQSMAAAELGVSEPTLRRRMKKFNIKRTAKIRSS